MRYTSPRARGEGVARSAAGEGALPASLSFAEKFRAQRRGSLTPALSPRAGRGSKRYPRANFSSSQFHIVAVPSER